MPPGHEDVLGEEGDANRLGSATLQGGLLGQYILRSTLVQPLVRFKLSGRSILRAHLNISTARSERKRPNLATNCRSVPSNRFCDFLADPEKHPENRSFSVFHTNNIDRSGTGTTWT
jgi:hypothetical protein